MAKHADGEPWDPFDPGAFVPGVTSAFKRFFPPYCELQVLFDAQSGRRVSAEAAAAEGAPGEGLPWGTLLQLTNLLLEERIVGGVPELRQMLRRRKHRGSRRTPEIAEETAPDLAGSADGSRSAGENEDVGAMFLH